MINISNRINNLNENEMLNILEKVDKNIDSLREGGLNDIYNSNIAILKKKNSFVKKIKPELREKIQNISKINNKNIETYGQNILQTSEKCKEKLSIISNKIINRLCNVLHSPITKAILIIGTSIIWFFVYVHISTSFMFELIKYANTFIANPFNLNIHSVINNGVFIAKVTAIITLSFSAGLEFIQSFSKSLKDTGLTILKYALCGLFFINVDTIFEALYFLSTPIFIIANTLGKPNSIL